MMDLGGKSKISLKAPAKVNLQLKIVGRFPNGTHDLKMIMVKLELADKLELEIGGKDIRIECDTLPSDSSNLVWRAADLVRKESGKKFGLIARLQKKIPIGAGLGGGSSDAASTLIGLNALLDLRWDESKLRSLAVRLGADVPFFIVKGPQRVEGFGDILSPMEVPKIPLILVTPDFPVSTAEAYSWYDISPLTRSGGNARRADFENDLEEVVFPRYPVLAEIKKRLGQTGALGTLMSGSGSTVFACFKSETSRDQGYEILMKDIPYGWWVCKTATLD